MAKYTREQIESKLDKVFDSVMQTKEVEVSEDTTIKADDGFLGLKEVNVKVSGGGGGNGEGKIGMLYVTKGDLFTFLELPSDMNISNEEFTPFLVTLTTRLPFSVVAFRGSIQKEGRIFSKSNVFDEVNMNFTCASWNAVAIDVDAVTYIEGLAPYWQFFAPTIAEAKVTLSQMFPNQMTEAEFFA